MDCRDLLIIAENIFSIIPTNELKQIHGALQSTSLQAITVVAVKDNNDIVLQIVNSSKNNVIINQPTVRFADPINSTQKAFETKEQLAESYKIEPGGKQTFRFFQTHTAGSVINANLQNRNPTFFVAFITTSIGEIYRSRDVKFEY